MEPSMQIMSVPAVVGISFGVAIAVTFAKKNRERSKGQKAWLFLRGFLAALAALLLVNFGIFYYQNR